MKKLSSIFLALILTLLIPILSCADLVVSFVDVGQGDAALIRCDGHNMLIDAGTNASTEMLLDYLDKNHSPKSVRNAHGLLSAALAEACPELVLRTKLPAKVKPDISVPEDKTVQAMVRFATGTEMETVLLLAAMLGLRRSEIAALVWDAFDAEGKTLRINSAMVKAPDGAWVIKSPKTYAGSRVLTLPNFLADHLSALPRKGGYIVPVNPDALTKRFDRLREHFRTTIRLHDLRHPYVKPTTKNKFSAKAEIPNYQ